MTKLHKYSQGLIIGSILMTTNIILILINSKSILLGCVSVAFLLFVLFFRISTQNNNKL